jgi:hypothetical protein
MTIICIKKNMEKILKIGKDKKNGGKNGRAVEL